MNKRFSYDNIIKSQSIEPNDLIRTYKLDRCCDFMEAKFNNPKLTQKEICKQLGFSDSTIKRYRDDIKMDSPYRKNTNKKKKPRQSQDTTMENISENKNTKPVSNKRSKNNVIKGGNVSDTHTLSGRELIEHAFQNDKADSILENKQEDNKKYITIARRMVDNA